MKLTSLEFLSLMGTEDEPKNPVLPHEHALIEHALKLIRQDYEHNLSQKIEVAGGADDWHDGAFITTDEQAKRIGQQARELSQFSGAPEVDYPLADQAQISLGSRVVISQNGFAFPVDIVGFRLGHPDNLVEDSTQEVTEVISPEAPIARAILGLSIGDSTHVELLGEQRSIEVLAVDQVAIREHFTVNQ